MRSSKSRSRNKSNRNRSSGNNMNRVFDSSGPEGKVRGTPQQIIEKYSQLTQDAILANDRVAAENFQQHGEHYARLFAKSQKEAEAKREAHEQQQRDRQQGRNEQQQNSQNRNDRNRGDRPQSEVSTSEQSEKTEQDNKPDLSQVEQPDVIADPGDTDSGLVETPEQPAAAKKPRARRKPKPVAEDAGKQSDTTNAAE